VPCCLLRIMAMEGHTIWGGLEASADSKVGSNSSGPSQDGEISDGNIPSHIMQHLANIDFRDNSSSTFSASEEASRGGSAINDAGRDAQGNKVGVEDALRNRLRIHCTSTHEEVQTRSKTKKKAKVRNDDDDGSHRKSHSSSSGGDPGHAHFSTSSAMEPAIEVSEEDQREFEAILANAGLWSKGCAQHAEGKCRPCHYVHCRVGCSNGKDCEFCHFPHTDKNRQRIGMSKRLYCKNIATMLEEACREHPEKFPQIVRASSSRSSYLHSILKERLDKWNDTGMLGSDLPSPAEALDKSRPNILSL